jgi:hypothetical protein
MSCYRNAGFCCIAGWREFLIVSKILHHVDFGILATSDKIIKLSKSRFPGSSLPIILLYTWYMDKRAGRSIYRAGRACETERLIGWFGVAR